MNNQLDINKIGFAAQTLKVLAHPARIQIVEFLENGENNVGNIQNYLGLQQAVTSQHLKTMLEKGLLKKRRQGNFIFYSLNGEILNGIMNCIRDCQVAI